MTLRLLKGPTICHLQAGDPGKGVVLFQSKPEGLRTRGANSASLGLTSEAQELGSPMSKGRRE
jgi:hypothetical protein